jgi:pantoate kinase
VIFVDPYDAELGRIYAEINNKLTAEIGKIKTRDILTKEAQKNLIDG